MKSQRISLAFWFMAERGSGGRGLMEFGEVGVLVLVEEVGSTACDLVNEHQSAEQNDGLQDGVYGAGLSVLPHALSESLIVRCGRNSFAADRAKEPAVAARRNSSDV